MSCEARALKIKLLILDVDGVLTDGGLYYDDEGRISKRFNVQDGLGIKLAQGVGLAVAVITGLKAEAVARRIKELGIEEYWPGNHKKVPLVEEITRRKGLTLDEVAYLGDDWVDAGPMRRVGLPMAVANAQPEILELAAWVSSRNGGHGAVREAIRFILSCQGKYEAAWQEWGA